MLQPSNGGPALTSRVQQSPASTMRQVCLIQGVAVQLNCVGWRPGTSEP